MNRLDLHRAAEAQMQDVARVVENMLPHGILFTVLTFTPNAPGEVSYSAYVSNAQRPDMIAALRGTADRLEARTTSGGFAEIEELHGRLARHERRAAAKRDRESKP